MYICIYVVGSRIESYRGTGTIGIWHLAFGNTYEISSNEVTRYSYNVHLLVLVGIGICTYEYGLW